MRPSCSGACEDMSAIYEQGAASSNFSSLNAVLALSVPRWVESRDRIFHATDCILHRHPGAVCRRPAHRRAGLLAIDCDASSRSAEFRPRPREVKADGGRHNGLGDVHTPRRPGDLGPVLAPSSCHCGHDHRLRNCGVGFAPVRDSTKGTDR